MSDSSNDSSKLSEDAEASEMPEGIEAPPPPDPDILDPSTLGPTYTQDNDGKRVKTGRSHPTDPYDAIKKKKGCGGCCGCLTGVGILVAALFITLVVIISCFGPGKYAFAGYKVVVLDESKTTITQAPTEATWYIGQDITYSVPETRFPIAITGVSITIGGEFFQTVSLSAGEVTGKSTARFNRNLEIYANQFNDEGITLNAKLSGRVIEQ